MYPYMRIAREPIIESKLNRVFNLGLSMAIVDENISTIVVKHKAEPRVNVIVSLEEIPSKTMNNPITIQNRYVKLMELLIHNTNNIRGLQEFKC